MIIHIPKDILLTHIQTVQSVISSKVTLPILSNIYLNAHQQHLTLNATDLDMGISCELPVDIVEEGGITIPAKRFSDIIRELPAGTVTIHAKKNNQVDISAETCRFKLHGLPCEEFPEFPDFKDKEIILIEQPVLKEMLRLTSFAVSHEESRYVFNGVLFEVEDKHIRLVATDGRRLAKIEKPLLNKIKDDISVVIPIKAINEISRNLKEEGEVSICMGNNQVLFNINGILIATRIIEGDFPNYNQVIPPESSQKIKINTQDFLAAIRRANLLTTQDFQVIKFEVFKDKMVVSKNTPDIGESREEVRIEYGGPEFIVGFNPHYLIDFLKNIDDEIIPIELLGPNKPCVVRLRDYFHLTLPMRV